MKYLTQNVIGYVIEIEKDGHIEYIGKCGARLIERNPRSGENIFKSISSAVSYIHKKKPCVDRHNVLPVYETEEPMRIVRSDTWEMPEETFELLPRKRPYRARKDGFRNYAEKGPINPRASMKIPKLRAK